MTKDEQHAALDSTVAQLGGVLEGIHPALARKLSPHLSAISVVATNHIDEHVEPDDNPSVWGTTAWFEAIAECEVGCSCSRHALVLALNPDALPHWDRVRLGLEPPPEQDAE